MAYVKIPVPFIKQAHGLGNVVASMTKAVGVKPCEPCKRRQHLFNRAVTFRPARRRRHG